MFQGEIMLATNKTLITDFDKHLFSEGKHFDLYHKFGANVASDGVHFSVWAPNAQYVSVIGDFNHWKRDEHPLHPSSSGIWMCFISGLKKGEKYKFFISSSVNGYEVEKADPYAKFSEVRPNTASIIWDDQYQWADKNWLKQRMQTDWLKSPVSIYEVHFGSWQRKIEDNNRAFTYREMATILPKYAKELGYTHVEFMPLTEFPYDPSWGYQTTGYFAPTSRFGTPEDFKFMIDCFHHENIGVILDWVPAHFPTDQHGLAFFDGTHLYEHQGATKGFHPDWGTLIFNYGRTEVRQFLINSALTWLDEYHIDGLRVDAVASMLYLDYSRKYGEWSPNEFGGNENLDAISFVKEMNEVIFGKHKDILMIAEESTAFSGVSRPTFLGGLGFNMKWDMGWMHDTLVYLGRDPVHRKFHHHEITFRMVYAFTENYCVALSHDEVVHGKGSMLSKMPGDSWQKFANLRLLYSYMYSIPGKKINFMGNEFAQNDEWDCNHSLDWHLLQWDDHKGIKKITQDLNTIYKKESAFFETDFSFNGFEYVNHADNQNSVISYLRKSENLQEEILVIINFTPTPQHQYRTGVNRNGEWEIIFNSDSIHYGGTNAGSFEPLTSEYHLKHERPYSLVVDLPPLGALFLKWKG
jgi:1,4-alpha-glucan branching enzyme